jgi:Na+/H+ antiporter NhaB
VSFVINQGGEEAQFTINTLFNGIYVLGGDFVTSLSLRVNGTYTLSKSLLVNDRFNVLCIQVGHLLLSDSCEGGFSVYLVVLLSSMSSLIKEASGRSAHQNAAPYQHAGCSRSGSHNCKQ